MLDIKHRNRRGINEPVETSNRVPDAVGLAGEMPLLNIVRARFKRSPAVNEINSW